MSEEEYEKKYELYKLYKVKTLRTTQPGNDKEKKIILEEENNERKL